MTTTLRIATRKSALALWQAEHVKARLEQQHGVDVELVGIETKGDKILDVALAKVGGKGLFVKELEQALLDGRVDLCVHSTKDVPAELPAGTAIVAFPPRADPRDCFADPKGQGGRGGLSSLPRGARVGTSSLRRQAQLLALRPDLVIVPVRGNASLEVVALAPAYNARGQATFRPTDRWELADVSRYRTFRQLAFAGSFEGETTFGIGVRTRLPFRAFAVEGPAGTKLVIDVAHRWP